MVQKAHRRPAVTDAGLQEKDALGFFVRSGTSHFQCPLRAAKPGLGRRRRRQPKERSCMPESSDNPAPHPRRQPVREPPDGEPDEKAPPKLAGRVRQPVLHQARYPARKIASANERITSAYSLVPRGISPSSFSRTRTSPAQIWAELPEMFPW